MRIIIEIVAHFSTAKSSKKTFELFCGKKLFTKVAELHDISMTTLNIDEKHHPTICTDILTWKTIKYFHFITLMSFGEVRCLRV